MSIPKHIRTHLILGTPQTDVNGNIQANVIPRTGTLPQLMTVSDGGDGEIATATDEHAQVMYRGSPSVATALFANYERGPVLLGMGFSGVAASGGGFAPLTGAAVKSDPDGRWEASKGYTMPTSSPLYSGQTPYLQFTGAISLSAADAGMELDIAVMRSDDAGATWAVSSVARASFYYASAKALGEAGAGFTLIEPITSFDANTRFVLGMQHSGANSIYPANGYVRASLIEMP